MTCYAEKVRFMHHFSPTPDNRWSDSHGMVEQPDAFKAPAEAPARNPIDYIYAGPAECFPLYSILLALNRTVVDFFGLDTEGVELRILKTIPFDKLTIKFLAVETVFVPEGDKAVADFLETKGFKTLKKVSYDMFFVHKDFVHEFDLT